MLFFGERKIELFKGVVLIVKFVFLVILVWVILIVVFFFLRWEFVYFVFLYVIFIFVEYFFFKFCGEVKIWCVVFYDRFFEEEEVEVEFYVVFEFDVENFVV